MAPFKERSIFVPVFFDGTLPRYGFCRCVAWALGVVVPSAGLMGWGVAIEYPSGSKLCPKALCLRATEVEAIIKAAPNTPRRNLLLALAPFVIRNPSGRLDCR